MRARALNHFERTRNKGPLHYSNQRTSPGSITVQMVSSLTGFYRTRKYNVTHNDPAVDRLVTAGATDLCAWTQRNALNAAFARQSYLDFIQTNFNAKQVNSNYPKTLK